MLEGKEVQGNIGSIGSYSADLDDKGNLVVAIEVHVDLVAEAKKLAAKTNTAIDDKAIEWLEKLMGR